MTKIAASIVENCDAIDRASSFSRENTWLVGRGRTYARRGAKEEAGEGIAIGRSGDQVVGARDATETCQYTFDHQACEFARRFSSVITVRNISYCSRVRVYIFLFLTLFFRVAMKWSTFNVLRAVFFCKEAWIDAVSSPFRSFACWSLLLSLPVSYIFVCYIVSLRIRYFYA